LRNLRVITYDLRDPAWGDDLRKRIEIALKEVLEAPELAVPPAFLKEKGEAKVPTVSPLEKRVLELTQQVESLRRSQSQSRSTSLVISPEEAREMISRYIRIRMPDKMILERMDRRGVSPIWAKEELKRIKAIMNEDQLDQKEAIDAAGTKS
jgi:hypothetical protein